MKMFDWLLTLKYRINTHSKSKRRPKDYSAYRVATPSEILEERKLMTDPLEAMFISEVAMAQSSGLQHPDIVVISTEVSNDRVDDGKAHVGFTIENRGDGPAENFGVSIIHSDDQQIGNDDDVSVGTTQVDFLAAGASRRIEMDVELDSRVLFERSQRDASSPELDGALVDFLATVVDPKGELFESNTSGHLAAEDNNVNQELYRGVDSFTSLPADIDGDGFVAPLDALNVIAAFGTPVTTDNNHLDMDGDGVIAPLDALAIINQIGTSSVTTADASLIATEDSALTGDLDDSLSAPAGSSWTLLTGPTHGTVNVEADGSFALTPDADFHGEDAFRVTRQLNGASTDYTIKLNVTPVNDTPIVLAAPSAISLTNASPNQTLDLRTIFTDRDGEELTFKVASTTGNVLNASVSGDQFILSSLPGRNGTASVTVEATDQTGDVVSTTVSVDVNRNDDQLLVHYALVSDQVVEFGGRNTFVLNTNVEDPALVTVYSANGELLPAEHVTLERAPEGGLRVKIHHQTNDFGLTNLQFRLDDRVVSDVLVMVLPGEDTDLEVAREVDADFDFTIHRTDGNIFTTLVTDRSLAASVANGSVPLEEAFEVARGASPQEVMFAHITDGASYSVQFESDVSQTQPQNAPLSSLRLSGNGSENVNLLAANNSQPNHTTRKVVSRLQVSEKVNLQFGLGQGPVSENDNSGRPIFADNGYFDPNVFASTFYKDQTNPLSFAAPIPSAIAAFVATPPIGPAAKPVAAVTAYVGQYIANAGPAAVEAGIAAFRYEAVLEDVANMSPEDAARLGGQIRGGVLAIVQGRNAIKSLNNLARNTDELVELADGVKTLGPFKLSTDDVQLVATSTVDAWSGATDSVDAIANMYVATGLSQQSSTVDGAGGLTVTTLGQEGGSLTDVVNAETQFQSQAIRERVADGSVDSSMLVIASSGDELVATVGPRLTEIETKLENELKDLPFEESDRTPSETELPETTPAEDQESTGENGDEAKRVNDVLAGAVGTAKWIYETGKTIVDIAHTAESIIDNVGAIFGSASGEEGDYQDQDGRTYNLYVSQNRIGSDGRDVINSGYRDDRIESGKGRDRVNAQAGDDVIIDEGGSNNLVGGGGNDRIVDGDGGSILSGGRGDDTILPGGGNDLIEGGEGDDWIIYTQQLIGNDILVDPSRLGTIQFTEYEISQIEMRKDNYDLEIILPSNTERTSNTLRLAGFFQQDGAGWEVIDRLGNRYSLYSLTGRVTAYAALTTAFAQRTDPTQPVYPEGVEHLTSLKDSSGRFTLHVAADRRLDSSASETSGLVVFVEGDRSIDGWISRNEFASLDSAGELLTEFNKQFDFGSYETVSVVGVGEGGLVAQWFSAAAAASIGPQFVNAQLINSPDISGLILQVVQADFPEYERGFPVLSTGFLVNANDWISKLGIWAGNDELYATWKAWDFNYDPKAELPVITELADVQAAHSPDGAAIDFGNLRISDLSLSHVRGVVSMMTADDLTDVYANVDVKVGLESFDSTTNGRLTLLDNEESEVVGNLDAATREIRTTFLRLLAADPAAFDPENPIVLNLDFGTADSPVDPDFLQVHSGTLYNPDITGVRTFGFETTEGLKGVDRGKATNVERDFVAIRDNTFIIDVAPGTYNVTVTYGDRENIRESVQLNLNGYATDRVSTMPGDFLSRSYQINTLDDQLRLSIKDRGGETDFAAINSVTIEQVQYRADVPPSEQLDDDPSIIVMTQSYELPETNAIIETVKVAAIAAASAALQVAGGALLGSTAFGKSVAVGLGGTLKTAAEASFHKGFLFALKKQTLDAAAQAALNSLVTSIPQNFATNPTARGVLGGVGQVFAGLGIGPHATVTGGHVEWEFVNDFGKRDVFKEISGTLKAVDGALTATRTVVDAVRGQDGSDANVAPWVYEVAASMKQMSQRFRLGKIDTGFVSVDLEKLNKAIADGKSPEQLLKLWTGSRDFLVLDYVTEGTELNHVSQSEHKEFVRQGARALKKLIEGYVTSLRETNPDGEIDLLLISHGSGYDINRELVERLNNSEIAEAVDFVKLVTLDPVSATEKTFTWRHPEMTTIVDRIVNIYQTENTPDGALFHGGSSHLEGLDGLLGGGAAGFYNRSARIFDLATSEELLRFRHWDTNTVELSAAELTDIEFSPDGKLVATAGRDGIVTVRHVDDVLDLETGDTINAAGDVEFEVWGQESRVRSVAFMQIEVEPGEWKDFLLTISSPKNADIKDPEKNRILLTDVETGEPVWQGFDAGGTQIEASPSGNVIVSADRNGRVKVWRRNVELKTAFEQVDGELIHAKDNGAYIADLHVINDEYFVTAGLDRRLKVSRITEDGIETTHNLAFDGRVRSVDYDPYNGVLAVGAGNELSLWSLNRELGRLERVGGHQTPVVRDDHQAPIQGVSFSKPGFLLDEDGNFNGDRHLPRTEHGDIDIDALPEFLTENGIEATTLEGLKLLTGGEDRTLFLYQLDKLDIGLLREESVLSGSMLPIREVTLSADGRRVALVGQDNIEERDIDFSGLGGSVGFLLDQLLEGRFKERTGGPIKDIDVTDILDERLGWKFSEIFLQARREHNAVPYEYIYQILEEGKEDYLWLRNNAAANRPGSIDPDHNLTLKPNDRGDGQGKNVEPIDIYLRPGKQIEVKPRQHLLDVERPDYQIDESTLSLGEVKDENGTVIGTLRQKNDHPNVLVFKAADELDYSADQKWTGEVEVTMFGPEDIEGVVREVTTTINFHVINHRPTANADIVTMYPEREVEFRPKANDYDFDSDEFNLFQFENQTLMVGTEQVGTARLKPGTTNVLMVKTTVTPERFAELLAAQKLADPSSPDFLTTDFEYTVRENRLKARSTGSVQVRIQLQEAPSNLRATEIGGDQFMLNWEPVGWQTTKYVIQQYESVSGEWVKHSETVDGNRDSKRIRGLSPNTDYQFRVVAKNSNRSTYSHELPEDFAVLTPDYEASEFVTTEPPGSGFIEVRWAGVHWAAKGYRVELRELIINEDGTLAKDENDEYRYLKDEVRHEWVSVEEKTAHRFGKLTPGTAYLPVVIAKDGDREISREATADAPVMTLLRQFPSGIKAERSGPTKIRVSWSKVEWNTEKYRIVAINPDDLADREYQGVVPVSGSQQKGVITGLTENTDYIVLVEALDRNGNWVSALPDPDSSDARTVLSNQPVADDESQINLSDASGSFRYLMPEDFATVLQLPSVEGVTFGTEFTIFNLASSPVQVESFGEESVQFEGQAGTSLTLPPAAGEVDDPANVGNLLYRCVRGTYGWQILVSTESTEAILTSTTVFLASEPDTLDYTAKPKSLKVNWQSPYWNIKSHRVVLYKAILNSHGEPFADSDGDWIHEGNEVDRSNLINVDDAPDQKFAREFKELEQDVWYVAELITKGHSGLTVTQTIKLQTGSQVSPTGIHFEDVTLHSATVNWTKEEWNVKKYRVSYEELDAAGNVVQGSQKFAEADATKSRREINGLSAGKSYRVTVEAKNADGDWLGNTSENFKILTMPSFELPDTARITLDEAGNHSLTINWENVFVGDHFAADSLIVKWSPVDSSIGKSGESKELSGDQTAFRITGLERDAEYNVVVEFAATIDGQAELVELSGSRSFSTAPVEEPVLSVPAEEIGLKSFRVNWTHPRTANDGLKFYNVRISKDGGITWFAAWNGDRSGMKLPGSRETFEVKGFYNDAGNEKRLEPGTEYLVRIRAVYEEGNDRNPEDIETVSTKSRTGVSDIAAVDVKADSFKVTWQHDDAAGVKAYRVRVKPAGNTEWTDKHVIGDTLADGPFELTVNKLKAANEYDVQVRAIYVKADPANGVKQETVDVEIASPVKTASLSEISSFLIKESRRTEVDFQWTAPAGTESLILEWTGNDNSGSKDVTGLSSKTIDFGESGNYEVTLVAQSGGSIVRAEVIANPVGYPAPDAPVLKTGTNPGRRQFEIQWDFPGDPLGNVEEFRIVRDNGQLFGVAGPDARTKIIQTRSSDRVDVTVNPNTEYRLKVVAVYKNGTKTPSDDYGTFRTAGGIAPSGLRVSGTQSRQTTLHWEHSDTTGVDFFRIRKSTNGGATWEVVGDVSTGTRSKTITGLSPNTSYIFQTRAVYRTEASGGEWESYDAQTGVVRTSDVSLTGVRVTGVRRKQFDVAWNSVADWAGSTKVQWRRAGTSNWSGSGSLGGGKTNYEITGLNHNTNYEIRVTASGGGVERSMTISRPTADVVKPSSPTYSGVSQTQVTVNWTHSDPAGPAEGFAVFRNGSKIADVGPNTRSFVAKSLKVGTTYSFQIRAKYGVGNADGPASSITTKTPVYHTPTGLSASNVKKQEFTVHWSFAGNLSDVDEFRVFRTNGKLLGITSTLQKTIKDRNNPPVVIDIKPGVEYEFFIRVIYKDGHKSDSGTITIKTLK